MKTIPYLFRTRLTKRWPACPTGNDHGAAARTIIRWFKLQVSSSSLSCSAHGRIYASADSNHLYFMPSVAVNAAGDRLLGLSGSKATEHVGAFWAGRKASGQTTRPLLIQVDKAYPHAPCRALDPTTSAGTTIPSRVRTLTEPRFGRFKKMPRWTQSGRSNRISPKPTRGVLELPPSGQTLKTKKNESQEKPPDLVSGTRGDG